MPDLTEAVSAPRVAAIEYPFSLTGGIPGDANGQRAVLRETLYALATTVAPGDVRHLQFEPPERALELNIHPPESPPIVKHIIRHPWQLPRLMKRRVPV